MLRQTISQKMLQKLSPQQIQLMKLLQIPTVTLEQRIKEELEANPALEEGERPEEEDFSSELEDADAGTEEPYELDEYLQDYIDEDPASYKTQGDSYYADEEDKQIPIAVQDSFHEHLDNQLGQLEDLDERQLLIAQQIIGSIDQDGYLRREPQSIVDDLMFSQNLFCTEEEVVDTLKCVQRFDPPGVGARDLQECLLIQIDQKLEAEKELPAAVFADLMLARRIIDEYFDAFSKKHYEKLIRQMDADEDELRDALKEILRLNPKPASGYSTGGSRSAQYVVPDFIITNRDGELELELNSRNAPELRISDQYRDMLKHYRASARQKKGPSRSDRETALFIKQKIDSAKWFIDAIRQRQQTLYSTMYAIMQYQYEYFLSGDEKRLRPMILKDIADITGLDISTVSRVANSKFVQTEFGTHRLKDFFSESLSTQEGEEVSTIEVKKVLGEIIDAENKRKPLSDEKLKNLLRDKGYDIARRTVAKYREQLNIPVARLRKEL